MLAGAAIPNGRSVVPNDFVPNGLGSGTALGTLTIVDLSDTIAFVGAVALTGSLAQVDAPDTVLFSAPVQTVGDVAITDASDTFLGAGTVLVSGSLAILDESDILAGLGGVSLSGFLDATDNEDFFAADGTIRYDFIRITAKQGLAAELRVVEQGLVAVVTEQNAATFATQETPAGRIVFSSETESWIEP